MDLRYRLVTIGLAVPYDGISHAGGEYVRRHLAAIRTRTLLVAPSNPENLAAMDRRDPDWIEVQLVASPGVPFVGLWRLINKLTDIVTPIFGSIHFIFKVATSRSLRHRIASADVVEFQWTQTFWLSFVLPRSRAKYVGISHDVVSQSIARRSSGTNGVLSRMLGGLVTATTRSLERVASLRMDEVVVFSEKDCALLRELGVKRSVVSVPPALTEPGMPRSPSERFPMRGVVLTVGNFARPENAEALVWLVEQVWPLVRQNFNDARLRVVGAGIPSDLRSRFGSANGVDLVGYVADLSEEYRQAWSVAVPVRRGAGVKFKAVTALLWGVPTVSTTCGAEGIGSGDVFAAVTDEANLFALALVDVLSNDSVMTLDAFTAVSERYGPDRFARRLAAIYSQALTVELEDG